MLHKIISLVESGNNQYAMRFEENIFLKFSRHTYSLIKTVAEINQCSLDTSRVILACSWGKYQILGINLYTICKLKNPVLQFVCNETLQDEAFNKFIIHKKVNATLVEQDIKALAIEQKKIKEKAKSIREFTENFKKYIVENKDTYPDLFSFITKYNGTKFCSDNFYAYLLRILYFYNKLAGGE